jgi:hypothetical protein
MLPRVEVVPRWLAVRQLACAPCGAVAPIAQLNNMYEYALYHHWLPAWRSRRGCLSRRNRRSGELVYNQFIRWSAAWGKLPNGMRAWEVSYSFRNTWKTDLEGDGHGVRRFRGRSSFAGVVWPMTVLLWTQSSEDVAGVMYVCMYGIDRLYTVLLSESGTIRYFSRVAHVTSSWCRERLEISVVSLFILIQTYIIYIA